MCGGPRNARSATAWICPPPLSAGRGSQWRIVGNSFVAEPNLGVRVFQVAAENVYGGQGW